MKVIKYRILSHEMNYGTEEEPEIRQFFRPKTMPWSEENAALAKLEAYGDEPEVFDDGKPEPSPSSEDRIAELEAALELLLSGAVE